MTDYQWPYGADAPASFNRTPLADALLLDDIARVEHFFENLLNVHAVLVPSGRAALGMILRRQGLSRQHVVFAPKFSSHCVWDAIGRTANPTTTYSDDLDAAVVVHKWGTTYRAKRSSQTFIVEDSVDSFFVDGRTLFPNDGTYEVISLPKVLGTMGGGIVLSRDRDPADDLRAGRHLNTPLAHHQAWLKFRSRDPSEASTFEDWSHLEATSTALEANTVSNVVSALPRYRERAAVIEKRLDLVSRDAVLATYVRETRGRLPPVVVVPRPASASSESGLMSRNFCYESDVASTQFQPSYLLPLHFGVGDEQFDALRRELRDSCPR